MKTNYNLDKSSLSITEKNYFHQKGDLLFMPVQFKVRWINFGHYWTGHSASHLSLDCLVAT
jgi:hypothetical protein